MPKINIVKSNVYKTLSDVIVVPIPARVRKKSARLNVNLQEFLKKYKLSGERFKEIVSQKEEFNNGEIYVIRDVNLEGFDIENPDVKAEEILEKIEKDSVLVVFLPIKTREDKSINEYVYMSSLRALAQFIQTDEEVKSQFDTISIMNFEGLVDSIPKLKEVFKEVHSKIFICLG